MWFRTDEQPRLSTLVTNGVYPARENWSAWLTKEHMITLIDDCGDDSAHVAFTGPLSRSTGIIRDPPLSSRISGA